MRYTSEIMKKEVLIEAYMPLKLKSEAVVRFADYFIYRCCDHSLLEIVFDEKDHKVYRINMPICKDCKIIYSNYELPAEFVAGDVQIDGSEDITTDVFFCEIYQNAVRVVLSNRTVSQRIVADNLVWELDENDRLVSLTVYNQPSEVIEHVLCELT